LLIFSALGHHWYIAGLWKPASNFRKTACLARQGKLITVDPKAQQEAERLDALRARGQAAGPLHGIPVILKDNYNTHDMVTTSGARAFAKLQPKTDAFTVTRLREAGAVIIAKANLTKLARHGMTVVR
jgi:amidase